MTYVYHSSDLITHAIIGVAASIGFFLWGWKAFRKKRIIEAIPTSKIRSIAMGLVEIKGRANPTYEVQAPYSGTKCVYYKYIKERYQRSGKSSRWVTIDKGVSVASFHINDETGQVLVEPIGIEFVGDKNYCVTKGNLRFTEWHIIRDETIYLIGTAQKSDESRSIKKARLLEKLSELKNNKEKMNQYDINKDGSIDSMEWDIACRQIEEELARGELKNEFNDIADISISKGQGQELFMASDKSEKDLLSTLNLRAFGGVIGGAALFAACLTYLIMQFAV